MKYINCDMRNLPIAVILFAFVILLASFSALTAAPALAKCRPGRANLISTHPFGLWYDGWQAGQQSNFGSVLTDMNNYSPWVEPVTPPYPGLPTSFVASVVSLNDYNTSTRNYIDYAEDG